MTGQTIEYSDGETTFEGYVSGADAPGARRPCVLIAPQWAGPSDHEREAADRLAGLGYVGFVLDYYGKGVRGTPGGNNGALVAPLRADRALLRRRLLAAVAAAKAHPAVDPGRIAVMGYCFGGLCALDLARSATPDVTGVVSLHGVFAPPDLGAQPPITAKVLILHGWEDPLAPPPDVLAVTRELTEAGADWQLHAYGHAMHAFTAKAANDPEHGLRHDAAADRRSWAATVAFLAEVFA